MLVRSNYENTFEVRTPSRSASILAAVGLLIASPAVHAKCSAADFTENQLTAQVGELNASTMNLQALSHNADGWELAMLRTAEAIVNGTADAAVMLQGMVHLHSMLDSVNDRAISAQVIEPAAEYLASSAEKHADLLTQYASATSRYGGELRAARDRLRAWARVVSCQQ